MKEDFDEFLTSIKEVPPYDFQSMMQNIATEQNWKFLTDTYPYKAPNTLPIASVEKATKPSETPAKAPSSWCPIL